MASDTPGRTSRLELADQSLREWDATVLDSSPDGIVLDRSAFYPGGGGQPPDHGTLLWGGVQTRIVGARRGDDLVLVPADGDPVPPTGTAVRDVDDCADGSGLRLRREGHGLGLQGRHGLLDVLALDARGADAGRHLADGLDGEVTGTGDDVERLAAGDGDHELLLEFVVRAAVAAEVLVVGFFAVALVAVDFLVVDFRVAVTAFFEAAADAMPATCSARNDS